VLTVVWFGVEVPVVGVIEVRGTLDKGKVQSVERRIDRARGRNVNFLILVLECEGGDATDAAYQLGKKLAELKDDLGERPVRTLAYIPSKRSIGAATYLALGCNEIVMASDAVLGDFTYLNVDRDSDHGGRRDQLADLAQRQGYSPALFEAMLDRSLVLYHAQLKGSGAFEVVTETEYQNDKKAGHVKYAPGAARLARKDGEYMKLDAALAKEYGIVEHNDVNDLDALYSRFDVSSVGVKVFRDDWLDEIAEFFRGPLVKMVLVMLGIIGLIIELKMPGTAIGGIVAGICFVLFFWAHSFIGEYTMLAVLLFVLGLILIGLEIFVFPGFGLPGISGILLIVLSLAIVTLEKMPSTTSEWLQLAGTLGTFAVSLVAAIAAAFMLAWYLPHIPYANRLVLAPPVEPSYGEGKSDNPLAALLGAIGVAETPLRPAGKVRFGEDYHDVIAEGDFVNPGSRVQVIEIEGQRSVVKQV
jgi:membrane-bound serine protease (ClpP class)